jgi:4-hydroxybenzoate polyprenyltransferase
VRNDIKQKALAYLQLMRLPNVFTAMADVMAGYFIVLGSDFQWTVLIGLCIATSALYAAGCVLNDICDRNLDAVERPSRPIPSKKVSLKEAYFLLCLLFAVGLLAALCAGLPSLFTALVLVVLIIAYDALTKDIVFLGAFNMGACRSCNLILGMSPALHLQGIFMILPLFPLVYVSSLTALSKFEVHGGLGRRGIPVLVGWIGVICLILWLKFYGNLNPWMFVYLALFILYTGPALLRSIRDKQAHSIGLAVKTLVLAIPILDAVYCAGFQGFFYGIPVILCIAPAVLIARYLYVT